MAQRYRACSLSGGLQLALCAVAAAHLSVSSVHNLRAHTEAEQPDCASKEMVEMYAREAGLSQNETAVLHAASVCIPQGGINDLSLRSSIHYAVPQDTQCTHEQWCDSQGICSVVCKRGSVKMDPWYAWASAWQRSVAKTQPFCYTSLLGTHNSAISIADGYGNQDKYWEWYLRFLPDMGTKPELYTNNQWISLTDQLNVGVRLLELDTHWVAGALRAAHCGGLHAKVINQMLKVLNSLAKLAGSSVHWDTETVGCSPSLSSLPVEDQRQIDAVLAEVRAWLEKPHNSDEFVVLFLDDEEDLGTWGKVERLTNLIQSSFPRGWLWTPEWKGRVSPGVWPSVEEMRGIGARVTVVSRRDYGEAAWPVIFNRTLCDWWEPHYVKLTPPPYCYDPHGRRPENGAFSRVNDCRLVYGILNCDFVPRSPWDRAALLTPPHLQQAATCGWNCLSPDWMTPSLAHSTIWSWAPGEPKSLHLSSAPVAPDVAIRQANALLRREAQYPSTRDAARAARQGAQDSSSAEDDVIDDVTGAVELACVALGADDGRWRTVPCAGTLRAACRARFPFAGIVAGNEPRFGETGEMSLAPRWVLGREVAFYEEIGWTVAFEDGSSAAQGGDARVAGGSGGATSSDWVNRLRSFSSSILQQAQEQDNAVQDNARRGNRARSNIAGTHGGTVRGEGMWAACEACCPPGFEFAFPQSGWDNLALWVTLQNDDADMVMLPIIPGFYRG